MSQTPENKHKLYAAVILFVALMILLFLMVLPMFALYNSTKDEVASLQHTQPVTSGNQDDRQVKVSVHCRSDVNSLRSLIYELESHVPVLIIDKINIGKGYRTTFRNQQSKGSDTLDIRFDISGFLALQEGKKDHLNSGLDSGS